jgi:PAS domain S-box-containing protein
MMNDGEKTEEQHLHELAQLRHRLAELVNLEATRKRAEEALRESEERYRLLAENMRDAIWTMDIKNLRFTYMSPSITSLTGYSVEEVMSPPLEELLTPASYGLAMKTIAEELTIERREQKDPYRSRTLEFALNCKDGSTVWVEAKMNFLRDSAGRPVGILGVSRDITERKRAEEALRESEEKYRTLIERANDGICIIQEGIVKYLNLRLAEMWGGTVEEVTGTPFSDYVHPDERRKVVEYYKRRMAGEAIPGIYETALRRKDGSKVYAELNAGTVSYQGNVVDFVFVRDITERKQMEAALRERERRQKVILGSLPVGIFHIDTNGRFVEVNEALAARYNLKPEQMVGKSTRDLFPDQAESYLKSDREVLKSGDPQLGTTRRIKTPEGVRWVRLDKVPIKDAEGNVTGIIGFELDITERIQTHEALREREQFFSGTLNDMLTFVAVLKPTGEIIFVNNTPLVLIGSTLDDVRGMMFYDTEWWSYAEEAKQAIKKDIELCVSGETISHQIQVQTRDGLIWIEFSMHPIYDAGGEIKYLVPEGRDITERKRAEEALKGSEARYRALVESTEDSVYLVDQNCRYLFLNEKHLSRLGLSSVEIVGKPYGEFHSEEETQLFSDGIHSVFESGRSIQHEHRSLRDGRYFLRTLSPVKDSVGRTAAVTVVSKEITALKRVEEERKKLILALEAKNRELERFTYTVSHDLRSPLVTIQGFTAMLQEDLKRNKREEAENDVNYITKATVTMDQLLSETLRLSRIGRIVNLPEDVPFGEIVNDVLEQVAEQIRSSSMGISIAADLPTVRVDRMRIAEALANLMVNSINYRGDQPQPKIEIGYRREGNETVFFVKDNGIGIEKSKHEQVFELFFKVDKKSPGSGAGLAIVKRIVEVHGGRIWIESELGMGCTVCFTLPLSAG